MTEYVDPLIPRVPPSETLNGPLRTDISVRSKVPAPVPVQAGSAADGFTPAPLYVHDSLAVLITTLRISFG